MTAMPTAADTRTVLVVEDDPDFQLLTQLALEAHGFHVELTPSLHDTLDLLSISGDVFEAVVLDLDLPDQQGVDTLELVRSLTAAPIVVYSSATPARLAHLVGLGADAALSKVEDRADLARSIDETIERVGRVRPLAIVPGPTSDPEEPGAGSFLAIAHTIIDRLRATCGVSTWMVTRVVDDDWTVLAVHDMNYGIRAGDVLQWRDSFCSRMVEGRARIVADTATDHTYDDAPIGARIPIGCYVGYPIVADDGMLFGTLCGIQPDGHPDPRALMATDATFQSFSSILGSAITIELERDRLQRRLIVAEEAARQDRLTGLGNRRAWERAIRMEEARCARFGHHAGVAIVDLNGLKQVNDEEGHAAGDVLIQAAATSLEQTVREIDQVFRVGGDEFAILLPEITEAGLEPVERRLTDALAASGVSASIGVAMRDSTTTLPETVEEADARMYERKRRR